MMRPNARKTPEFSLCGLNCSLCPRFHTEGKSRCPGCGGPGFNDKHPSCGVMTCAGKNGGVEYCFECGHFPCGKYTAENTLDSFISYAKVGEDIEAARADLSGYLRTLAAKESLLLELIARFDDGRMKGFYCLAVNLLPLGDIEAILDEAALAPGSDLRSAAAAMREMMEAAAKRRGIQLRLRKRKG